eukprot:snap_masked-scaffold_4-processed-gene-18.34-mRNA-1 protein AED:1.00 eAED:1.00 QI:0/0/0/0/1/1/2/0/75
MSNNKSMLAGCFIIEIFGEVTVMLSFDPRPEMSLRFQLFSGDENWTEVVPFLDPFSQNSLILKWLKKTPRDANEE